MLDDGDRGDGGDSRDGAWQHEDVFQRDGSDPEGTIESLAAALEAEHQRGLRIVADFENHKRRTQRERQAALLYANEKLLKDLLPVLDDLKRALTQAEVGDSATLPAFVQGIRLIANRAVAVLEQAGVRSFPSVGTPFDPTLHEAVMQRTVEGAAPSAVVEELETGYRLHTRLLRPAKVVVNAKRAPREPRPAPAEPQPPPPPEAAAPSATPPEPSRPPREPAPDRVEESGRGFVIDEEALGSLEDCLNELES
ncbi:MAG: nucleotide exchange factor GrpE [Deltaproteobacteria bacterium]|nr:nucleotide exchange factor GrpE [Deltaproteobacteria bacterium]